MNPHKNLIISIAFGILFTACGGAAATPQITPAPAAPTAPPTATQIVLGCDPVKYDGVLYNLDEKDQIIDFRTRTHLIVITCIVDVPMIVDSHADPGCPEESRIEFDTFGGGNCQFQYRTDNFEVYEYLSWGSVQSQWPQGAPSGSPDEFPDEMPWPESVTPPIGPQA